MSRTVPGASSRGSGGRSRPAADTTTGAVVRAGTGGATNAFSSNDEAELRQAERDVTHAFEDQQFDFGALLAVSNVFRAATAVRNHMEREVLGPHQLSWSAFVVLFVLRVWGRQESHQLAREAGITGGTLTGVLTTLERRGFATRATHPTDGRRVLVSPTPAGRRVVDEIMPAFNRHEAMVTAALSADDKQRLSGLLRAVLRTLDGDLDGGPDSDLDSDLDSDRAGDSGTTVEPGAGGTRRRGGRSASSRRA